jgi:fatty-acyl-CoA synthase
VADLLRTTATLAHWPADTSVPLADLSLGDVLEEAADRFGPRCAIVDGASPHRRWTFDETRTIAHRVANALVRQFEPGEHIAIWAPTSPEWLFLQYGAALAGLTLVTVNPAFKTAEMSYVLSHGDAVGLFCLPEFRGNPMWRWLQEARPGLPRLRATHLLGDIFDFATGEPGEPLPPVRPTSPMQLQYTSGTTGPPKGAVLKHRSAVNVGRFVTDRLELREAGDVIINPQPMFHAGGSVLGGIGALWQGATHVAVPRVIPADLLALIESERGNALLAVTTVVQMLAEHPDFARRDVSSLRVVLTGGASIAPNVVKMLETALGANLAIAYGLTECSPTATVTYPQDSLERKAHTVGRALPQVEIKIIDQSTGSTLPINEPGEVLLRGDQLMLGYYKMPEETALAIDAQGWLHTGDVCSMDADGYLTFTGRVKDMIKRGGENVYPREIEELLAQHPSVREAAVAGAPDPKWGEVIVAFIVPRAGVTLDPAALTAFVRSQLAPYKVPVHWVEVAELPVTAATMKVRKSELVDQYFGASASPGSDPQT